jgi:hypothetical protein
VHIRAVLFSGSAVHSTNTNGIIDDDNAGVVKVGGDFCLELSSAGSLEVWAGPLTGGRWAVALFNRSPGPDTIRVDFASLPASDYGVQPATTFDVYNVWADIRTPSIEDHWSVDVGAHDPALLVLSPP